MLGKKAEAARPGDICAGLVVTRALIAVEAVLRARIDVDLDVGPLGADDLDVAERNARVLFPEMQMPSALAACRRRSDRWRRRNSRSPRIGLTVLSQPHRRRCRRGKSR